MFNGLRLHWHKAAALSVLQRIYGQRLTPPLAPDLDARLTEEASRTLSARGTPADTATAFMIGKAKETQRAGSPANVVGIERVTASLRRGLRLWKQHVASFERLRGDQPVGEPPEPMKPPVDDGAFWTTVG
jgi:hypothetical protein